MPSCQARYWLAYRDGKIVGRIAGILNNRHIEKWNQNYLRFSWIDFVDDVEVSKALLEAGINSRYYLSPETAHEWQTWRRSLREFAPLLFASKDQD